MGSGDADVGVAGFLLPGGGRFITFQDNGSVRKDVDNLQEEPGNFLAFLVMRHRTRRRPDGQLIPLDEKRRLQRALFDGDRSLGANPLSGGQRNPGHRLRLSRRRERKAEQNDISLAYEIPYRGNGAELAQVVNFLVNLGNLRVPENFIIFAPCNIPGQVFSLKNPVYHPDKVFVHQSR